MALVVYGARYFNGGRGDGMALQIPFFDYADCSNAVVYDYGYYRDADGWRLLLGFKKNSIDVLRLADDSLSLLGGYSITTHSRLCFLDLYLRCAGFLGRHVGAVLRQRASKAYLLRY